MASRPCGTWAKKSSGVNRSSWWSVPNRFATARDHGLSSSAASANVTLKVLTGWVATSDISPTTALESMPPDKNAP